jgi:hypothetical protein
MSKREEKALETTKKVAEEAKRTESINTSLDETKKNVRKTLDETRSQIPRYTNVVTNYQEQVLQSTGKMVEDYIEAQKSVMNAVFNSANPYYEIANRVFNYWFTPRVTTKIYARSVSKIAENVSASARIGNEILFGNIEALGNDFERAQRHTKEFMRINTNTAKAIENTSREMTEFSVTRQR